MDFTRKRQELEIQKINFTKKYCHIKTSKLNIDLLCEQAEMLCEIGFGAIDENEKLACYERARNYAIEALYIDERHAEANLVFVFTNFRLYEITHDCSLRIALGKDAKESLDIASQQINNDRTHFFFGIWQLEIAQLHILQIKTVVDILGYVPITSIDDALQHFRKAINKNPKRNSYYFYAAKCAYQLGDINLVKQLLHKGTLIPPHFPDDKKACEEMITLKKILN